MFELDGYYRLTIEMVGPSHTDDFDFAIRSESDYLGNPVSELLSAQNAHDTLTNLANGLISAMLVNNSSRWTSGSVMGVLKVPLNLSSV